MMSGVEDNLPPSTDPTPMNPDEATLDGLEHMDIGADKVDFLPDIQGKVVPLLSKELSLQ